MKKIVKNTLAMALAGASLFGAVACKKSDNGDYGLVVTYYKGGYGSEWIEKAASAYETQNGVKVKLISSTKLNCDAATNLKSGRNLSDVYICADSEWTNFVANGYIAELSDVYDTEVSTQKGMVKIKDYISGAAADKFYMQRKAGTGDSLPWVMPWSAQPGAMAINTDFLKNLTHHAKNGGVSGVNDGEKWKNPPATFDELLAFCKDVNEYESTDGYEYVPIGWCGLAPETLYYAIYAWWAELQGTESANYQGEGTFYDFWNFGNEGATGAQSFDTGVFLQSGASGAIDKLKELIVADGKFVNSLSDATKLSPQELQQTFVSKNKNETSGKQKPAIVLASSYLEYETKLNGYLDSDKDGVQDVNFTFMNVPKIGAESKSTVYCSYEDVMFVPVKAAHVSEAKKFLAFLCEEERLKEFSSITGGIRPFDYDPRGAEGLSEFTKSVYEVYFGSVKAYEYPVSASTPDHVSCIYRYERPTLFGNVPLATVLNDLKSKSGAEIMAAAKESVDNLSAENWRKKYKRFFGE